MFDESNGVTMDTELWNSDQRSFGVDQLCSLKKLDLECLRCSDYTSIVYVFLRRVFKFSHVLKLKR